MPYIKKEDRPALDRIVLDTLAFLNRCPEHSIDGMFNYFITRLLQGVYHKSYFEINRAIGVLECIKQEFYRRRAGPYEDLKIKENGDAYE